MNKMRILAAALLLICLTACGTKEAPEQAPVEPAAEIVPPAVVETPDEPEDAPVVEEPVAEEPVNPQYEQALSLIDGSVEDLYDTVGFPVDYMYADSCLGEGEDGELYYDGFTVYTYRDLEDNETIYDVMEN